jgi:hypothetical protein
MDYYEILGINSNANIQDIKNAYKKQAKLYHPDKLGEQTPEITFIELKEAYDTLSDEIKRTEYDIKQFCTMFDYVELSDKDYETIRECYNKYKNTNGFKFVKLLYKSLPKKVSPPIIQSMFELYPSAKWIDITQMNTNEYVNLYVNMRDAYKNNLKRLIIHTKYGIYYLFLRDFNQYLIIDNENCYLTLIFQTKNWKNCYRKNDDLYYVVSNNNCISLLELPDDSYYLNSLKYSLIPYKGFNNRGSIRIVKKL